MQYNRTNYRVIFNFHRSKSRRFPRTGTSLSDRGQPVSTTVSIVSSDVAGQGRRGRSVERGRGSDTFSRSRSRSTGPPLIIPRPRATKAARDVPRFDFFSRPLPRFQLAASSLSLSPANPFAGRLRGYRNHLTTSSRLGASPPPSPHPCPSSSLSRSIIAVFWIARVYRARQSAGGSLT